MSDISSAGRIKSYSVKNGYGFITEVTDYADDVFFGKEHLLAEWQLIGNEIVGREVHFELGTNHDGKAQARNVRPAGPPQIGQRTVGLVKSWSQTKGFGFLRVAGYERDVFFSRDRLPNECRELNQLENFAFAFELTETPDGKQQASRMATVGNVVGNVAQMPMQQQQVQQQQKMMQQQHQLFSQNFGEVANAGLSRGMMNMGGAGLKRPMHNGEMGMAKRQVARPGPDYNGRQVGVVKSFNPKNGYGFIVVPHIPEDIVIYARDMDPAAPELEPNTEVEFSIRFGNSNRPQAVDVVILDSGPQRMGKQQDYPPLTVDELKLYSAQLNMKDLGELAAYATQMLQSKLVSRR